MKTVETSVYELNPEVSPQNRTLLVRFRLFSLAGLALAMLAAGLVPR